MPADLVQANLDALDRYERGLERPLTRLRNQYGRQAIQAGVATGNDIQPIRLAYTAGVLNTLENMAKRAIPFFAKLTMAEIELADTKQDFETLYSQWINTRLFEHSQIIAETATNDVISIIQQLIADGAGDREIAKAIREFSKASPHQSRLIARTETHQAAMYAKRETAAALERRSGIEMVKFWNAAEDSRTRPWHAQAETTYSDGIPLNDRFIVDGEPTDRPGDPSASASNIINCRCVLTMRPKGV